MRATSRSMFGWPMRSLLHAISLPGHCSLAMWFSPPVHGSGITDWDYAVFSWCMLLIMRMMQPALAYFTGLYGWIPPFGSRRCVQLRGACVAGRCSHCFMLSVCLAIAAWPCGFHRPFMGQGSQTGITPSSSGACFWSRGCCSLL